MATSLTLKSGPLTGEVTTQNDIKAQEVIARFAHATGAPVDATPQQKIQHAAKELLGYMQRIAQQRYVTEESAGIQETAEGLVW